MPHSCEAEVRSGHVTEPRLFSLGSWGAHAAEPGGFPAGSSRNEGYTRTAGLREFPGPCLEPCTQGAVSTSGEAQHSTVRERGSAAWSLLCVCLSRTRACPRKGSATVRPHWA